MKKVIAKVSPNAKLDSYSGESERIYITARFDSAVELIESGSLTPARAQMRKNDSNEPVQKSAREKRNDSLNSKWKKEA
jgi:RNA processing factor Prp31